MSKKYLMGIDEGSQSAKITIFDTVGNIVCEAREPLRPYDLPKPGYVEHPDDDWWDAICKASKNVWINSREIQRIFWGLDFVRFVAVEHI